MEQKEVRVGAITIYFPIVGYEEYWIYEDLADIYRKEYLKASIRQ
ncbi:hypothetical protein JOC54_000463 [Alkalihalobacillus xiaoxiensis]|uniref:Uncharacterized protein n=1 Tax=Shouchella xiaoxiensis TaxID=766895 RepID=A0ABS2SNY8_9BACI|nr:hypothetical protein [Shouchella xiaoxiensis]MBM7837232.1 hypothetical protein [Shouchella xiaoxiensis]